MRRVLSYLRHHPLVWLVPLVFFGGLVLVVAVEVAATPDNPFVYDVR